MVFFTFSCFLGCSSWFLFWVIFELFGWVFLVFFGKTSESFFLSANLWKIFFFQFLSSSVFLLSFCMSGNHMYDSPFLGLFFMLGVLMKLGVPPFHGWVIQVSENLPISSFFFFNFLQKVGPSLIFIHYLDLTVQIFGLVFLLMVGSVGGWNLFSIHRFMVYSSIMNMGWIFATFHVSKLLFFNYLFCYCFVFWVFFQWLSESSYSNMNFPASLPSEFSSKIIFLFFVLNIMGVPPVWLFFLKFFTIKSLIFEGFFLMSVFVLLFTTIFSYMYLCLFSCQLFSKLDFHKKKNVKPLLFCLFFSSGMILYFSFF
uniref:NADH-ubiquinone oxidoreductase chain 2 n=1 Tax=Columbicola macrourae TaxID=128993 RepID=A0A6G7SJW9_9NEOP|nr:NADH dehydrogenase subunit 2 [Columbicola macrourae]